MKYVLDTRAFPWQEERYIPARGKLKPIYMTHALHGVHIAYTEQEIKLNEANGWVVYGTTPPGATKPVVMEEVKAKRKYTRKAK